MSFCYAPFSLWWLAWILPIPLALNAASPDPALRVRRAALFGFAYFGFGSWWLADTMVTHLDYGWLAAVTANAAIAAACALGPVIWCWAAGYFRRAGVLWYVALPCVWLVVEDVRFRVFGGGPWMSLGLSQVDGPLAGYVPVFGEIGTSAVVVLVVLQLTRLLQLSAGRRRAPVPVAVLLTVVAVGLVLQTVVWTRPAGSPVPIAMVQSATPQSEKQDRTLDLARIDGLARLSRPALDQARVLIWPETVFALDHQTVLDRLARLDRDLSRRGATLLLGAFEQSSGKTYNSVLTIGASGGQRYRKRHLVPFGETAVGGMFSWIDAHAPGDSSRGAGRRAAPIEVDGISFGVSICWEGSFARDIVPLVDAGAGVLVNVANEAWFAKTPLPLQNLDAARMRALETGREVVRVANSGPGGIIAPDGVVSTALSGNTAGMAVGHVTPRAGRTPFTYFPDGMQALFALALIGMIVVFAVRLD